MALFKGLGKWEKLNIIIIVLFLGGMVTFLTFSKPSITGYIPATYAIKDLEVVVLKNQSYILSSNDTQQLHLKSVLVSGKIIGEGEVKIFIEADGERYLIYSNERGTGLTAITGLAIKETDKGVDVNFVPELEQDILPELEIKETDLYTTEVQAFIELLKKEAAENKKQVIVDFIKNTEGISFKDECRETCMLFGLTNNQYRFIFEVDLGTILLVDEITYSTEIA